MMETRIAGPASRGPDRSGAIIGGAWGLAALVLSLTLVACGDGASPDTIEASGRPASAGTGLLTPSGGIPRYVLAVIDSSEGRTSTSNEVHRLAEFALQHLGYGVHYLDVDTQPLPPLDEMSPYAAVLTWFQDPRMRRPMEFIDWVEANVAAGRKYVLLGSAGVFRDSTTGRPLPTREPARLFKLLGAEFRGNFTDDSESIEVASAISELVEYERKLDPGLLTYQQVVSVDPENEVWLTVNRSDLTDGLSDVVFVGPAGGYAQEGYIFWEDLDSFRRHLRLDMFTFMRRALGRADWPAPDVTTLNGGRVLYSQIDGDGFLTITGERCNSKHRKY
ncbi:MAG: hypothetical protein IH956_10080 [Chloroflexi bacterium]|nr:hypothetical protein [Chloroflexota bacterium]